MDKQKVKLRRKEISDIINSVGLNGLNRSMIAEKYNISLMMVSKDVKVILGNVSEEKISEITDSLGIMFNEAIVIARKSLRSSDESIRLKAVNSLTNVISEFTAFLEAYGYKESVAVKLDVNTNNYSFCNDVKKRAILEKKSHIRILREIFKDLDLRIDIADLRAWMQSDNDAPTKKDAPLQKEIVNTKLLKKTNVNDEETMVLEEVID